MSDLISRSKLIESYCEDNCGERRCRDAWDRCRFISHVLEQPTVEALQWIPCSERLPNEYDYPEQRYRILASCSDGIVRNATIKTMLNGEKHYATGHVEFVYEAWMPLPEPYKGE